jgi:hypothetical protein
MNDAPRIAVLNELLAAEQQNLAPRLFESTLFVSRLDVEAYDVVRAMAQACREHCAALTELILDLGGQPAPRIGDVTTADLHFLELHYVLPRLIADQRFLEHKYAIAAPRLAADPGVAALVSRVLDRHRRDLGRIQSLDARTTSEPGAQVTGLD